MLWLDIQAPFAVCRPMVAGWYRPTAGFLTHSAVYGLLLNLARIESRLGEHELDHDGSVPASVTRGGLPAFRLALGLAPGESLPSAQSMYQQVHTYPVNETTGIPTRLAKGRKNHITPVRREILCDVRAFAVIEAEAVFETAVRRGIRGELNSERYGLPFLGDNNFLPDRLELVAPQPARWFTLQEFRKGRPVDGTSRLTTFIDRASMAGTRSALFAPTENATMEPLDSAFVPVGDAEQFDSWFRGQMQSI